MLVDHANHVEAIGSIPIPVSATEAIAKAPFTASNAPESARVRAADLTLSYAMRGSEIEDIHVWLASLENVQPSGPKNVDRGCRT